MVTLVGTGDLPDRVLILTDEYRFTSPNQITLSRLWGPGDGYSLIELRRVTSATDRLVNFSDGSILRAYDLNTSQIQSLHIAEEGRDISSQALINDLLGWDALNLRIRRLADPVDDQDAATKNYVTTVSNSDRAYLEQQLSRTLRGPNGEVIENIPAAILRASKVLAFDSAGRPTVMVPQSGSGVEVAIDLASTTESGKGAGMVGVFGTGKRLGEILETRIFPGIVLDHATTSWAKIESADYTVDKSAALSDLMNSKKSVVIDTQIALNAMVVISKDRANVSCSPGGILLAGPGMAQTRMLRVTGHHAILDKMNMDNPLSLKATTGGRQTAIEIRADHCTVMNSTFRRMLHAVMTEAGGGEWYMPSYINNLALECLGVGAGAGDTGANGYGEDRGDAFLIWGSTGIMAYNRAFCGVGQDARIAFHIEWLGTDFQGRPYDPKRDGFDQWMVHNFAYGNFRRHFAFESVRRGIMAQNVSGGGATWWPLAVTGGWDCLVTDMIINYDRPATNTAGAAWSPDRAAIGFGHNGRNTTLKNIKVMFSPDAVGSGLTSLVTNLPAYEAVLDNVQIKKAVGQGGFGFKMDNLPDSTMLNCSVIGAATGMTTFGAQDITIKGFTATDISGTAINLSGGVAGTHARIEGGRVLRANKAVNTTNLSSLSVRGLQTKGIASIDITQFGTSGAITLEGNHNEDGTGKIDIGGGGAAFTLAQVRNIGNNLGYTYNFKYEVACITNATSALNTLGKHTDKTVVATDGFAYIATGATPTSPWAKVSTLTTPA